MGSNGLARQRLCRLLLYAALIGALLFDISLRWGHDEQVNEPVGRLAVLTDLGEVGESGELSGDRARIYSFTDTFAVCRITVRNNIENGYGLACQRRF